MDKNDIESVAGEVYDTVFRLLDGYQDIDGDTASKIATNAEQETIRSLASLFLDDDECMELIENRGPRCPDCGEPGERKGHMSCQYPQD